MITDEPQAKRATDGTLSRIHLPGAAAEGVAIKGAFGPFAERRSRISVSQLHEVLRGKQMWFFPGHGDAMLQGDPVLAFEKDGVLEAVSMDTLVDIVAWHVKHGSLRLVVLTGCLTSQLGKALHERAGVPDVVCWSTLLHDHAGCCFGEQLAQSIAQLVMDSGEKLDVAAAFEAACLAVTSSTEPGQLDNGLPGEVQRFELHVDPSDKHRVDTKRGRLYANGRLAAGSPLHLSSSASAAQGNIAIMVDDVLVPDSPDFHTWCTFHEAAVGGQMVAAEHVAKKLFIYHALINDGRECYTAMRDELGNPWTSVITRGADGGLTYNGKPVSVAKVKPGSKRQRPAAALAAW